jgi:predicted transposase YbfD/YdcC
VDKGHGRIEVRTAHSCPLLKHWLRARGFTKAEQVVRIERVRRIEGEASVSVEYYVTSLDSTRATAFDLMQWIRAHWAIENQSHYVRDVTLGEDASRVRKGSSAEVMAALRNVVIHLLKDVTAVSTRAATHRMQVHPVEAIDLLNSTQCDK